MSEKAKKPFSVQHFLEVKMNQKLKENPEALGNLDCIFQFEIEDDTWNLDLSSSNPHIFPGAHSSPDCAIHLSAENFEKLVRGNLNIPMALVTGKFKITGEKALALKLAKLFS